MNKKPIILLVVLFLAIATIFYFFTKIFAAKTINIALQENINSIISHHRGIFYSYESTSTAISNHTINMGIAQILSQANNSTGNVKDKLRNKLVKNLQEYYNVIDKKGVSQYQFILANGESFYRFHSPENFGDNVLSQREDFKKSLKTKNITRNFVVSSFDDGFRNVFPIFDKNQYIGAMEVSFSSNNFKKYLNNISKIHSHILLSKNIIDKKILDSIKYKTSYEHKDYKSTLNHKHNKINCYCEIYQDKKNIIDAKIKGDTAFSVYSLLDNHSQILSFIPIKDINNKTIAWITSHTPSFMISQLERNFLMARVLVATILVLTLYFLIKQMFAKAKIEKQEKVLSAILNRTKNIMFITNFSTISFTNKKFDDLINKKSKKSILDIFLKSDGFLHEDLLEKSENFISLVKRTPEKDRIVSILGKDNKTHSYTINASKIEKDYLITLSNVTKLKEELIEVAEKAYIDDLTKVFNRNKFNEIFELEIKKNKRSLESLSVAIVDIDNFKVFNDTYGHLIGDEVLIGMAQTVERNIRETDTFARWGGEEFVILFTYTDIKNAIIVSNKIREEIQKNKHKTAGTITASFGITQAKKGDTAKSIFKRCDDALYMAKNNGRNRVEALV